MAQNLNGRAANAAGTLADAAGRATERPGQFDPAIVDFIIGIGDVGVGETIIGVDAWPAEGRVCIRLTGGVVISHGPDGLELYVNERAEPVSGRLTLAGQVH